MMMLVSLIRGVNVAGHNRVKTLELVELCQSLGFAGVRTYLQSGNMVFSHEGKDTASVAAKIEKALKQRLGLDATVFIRTYYELRNVVARNPFNGQSASKLHVTFLRAKPVNVPMDKLSTLRDRHAEFAIKDREVYLFLPNGIGRSKLSNNSLEKVLGMPATTRNWNTVTALSNMAAENSL